MHETVFSRQVISLIRVQLKKNPGQRVVSAVVALSPFSHVKPQALQQAFCELARGSAAESVELKIEPLEAKLECRQCKYSFAAKGPVFCCPRCASANLQLETGKEFMVQSLEVENRIFT